MTGPGARSKVHRYARAPTALWRRTLTAVLVRRPGDPLRTLPGTAAEIWDLLAREPTLPEIVADLAARYDATVADIDADVVTLIETLVAAGLVVSRTGPPTPELVV